MAMIMMMVITRRHLARKHSTNYKCAKEGCDKTFAKQYQVLRITLDTRRTTVIVKKTFSLTLT